MSRMKLAAVVVGAALILAGAPTWVAAQEDPASAFSEVLDVRVVNLEVVVTDRAGTRVGGLGREDFRLFVDGKPVPIDYFTEISGGVAAASEAGAPGIPEATPGERVGTSYLVFVDQFFAVAADRNRVLAKLGEQLGLLGPRDRMAVVAWDGNHLTMLSPWSGSRPELERALAQAATQPADGLRRLIELESFEADRQLNRLARIDSRRPFQPRDALALHFTDQLRSQVERAVSAATATLRGFASPPGRKVMLLLSGGWPAQPQFWALADAPFGERIERTNDLFVGLVQTANLLGYTLYPVDVPGMGRDSAVSAELDVPRSTLVSFQREQELHSTLERLAEGTGGLALLNSRRDLALETVATDTRSYYWLGFTTDRQFDERQHEVHIEVTRPRLALRHREGFQDFSRERDATMATESALLFGGSVGAQSFPARVGAARRSGLGKVDMLLELLIPVDRVTFLQSGDRWATQLELRIAVLDEAGGTADVPVVPISLTLPERPEPGTYVPYKTSVLLRKQHHQLVVSLYDRPTGAMLSSRLEVDPK